MSAEYEEFHLMYVVSSQNEYEWLEQTIWRNEDFSLENLVNGGQKGSVL